MTTSELPDLPIHTISNGDWQRLDSNELSLIISQWNLYMLQRMREYCPVPGGIPVERTEELKLSPSRYLNRYLAGGMTWPS